MVVVKYPNLRIYIYGLATIIVALIGFGSLHTRAHWFTDVLGGYLFGYLWLTLSLGLLDLTQRTKNKRRFDIKNK